MLLLILSYSLLAISIALFLIINPLYIGIIILFIAITSTLLIGFILSSWLCFLIFLIYIRGMLVLFSYFVAILPNIQVTPLTSNIALATIYMSSISIYITTHFRQPIIIQPEPHISFLYLFPSAWMLILLALVLLLTIIIVVKLVSIKSGPLRPYMYV